MDADILQELYMRYYSRAMLYTLSLCGDEELAKDLTAEAFVKAYLSLPEEIPSFPYCLMRVCKNLWLDHLKKQRRLTALVEAGEPVSPDTPETICLKNERTQPMPLARHWAAAAPGPEIVTLHYYSGLPLQQVAALVGPPTEPHASGSAVCSRN